MQARPAPSKPKYKISNFAATGPHPKYELKFEPNIQSCKSYCICNQFSLANTKRCSRCSQSYHNCVTYKSQNVADWECLHC